MGHFSWYQRMGKINEKYDIGLQSDLWYNIAAVVSVRVLNFADPKRKSQI